MGEYIQPIWWAQASGGPEPGPGNYYIFIHIICIQVELDTGQVMRVKITA